MQILCGHDEWNDDRCGHGSDHNPANKPHERSSFGTVDPTGAI
jgi:hypothetical protein